MSYWADHYVRLLQQGKTVQFRHHGNSMSPRIDDGDLVTVKPAKPEDIEVGDIILCKLGRHHYLHLVKAIKGTGQFLIGNNRNYTNGWCSVVYGKVIKVER